MHSPLESPSLATSLSDISGEVVPIITLGVNGSMSTPVNGAGMSSTNLGSTGGGVGGGVGSPGCRSLCISPR